MQRTLSNRAKLGFPRLEKVKTKTKLIEKEIWSVSQTNSYYHNIIFYNLPYALRTLKTLKVSWKLKLFYEVKDFLVVYLFGECYYFFLIIYFFLINNHQKK